MNRIIIEEPKRSNEHDSVYFCRVYLPDLKEYKSIYADSSDRAIELAKEFVESYLRARIKGIDILLKFENIKEKLTTELDGAKKELDNKNFHKFPNTSL